MLVQPGPEISAPRLGRLVQRLLEMETYRMMALLAMPAARHAVAVLGKAEQELGWRPVWQASTMIEHTARWYRAHHEHATLLSHDDLRDYVHAARLA